MLWLWQALNQLMVTLSSFMSEDYFSMKEMLQKYFDEAKEHRLEMRNDIKEIKIQTQLTNGRVNGLENTRTQIWTAIAVLIFLGGAIITLSIMAIDSKIEKAISSTLEAKIKSIEYEKD